MFILKHIIRLIDLFLNSCFSLDVALLDFNILLSRIESCEVSFAENHTHCILIKRNRLCEIACASLAPKLHGLHPKQVPLDKAFESPVIWIVC